MDRPASLARPGLPPSWRLALWGGIALLLVLPALAMQFTREVNWGPGDFAAAGKVCAAGHMQMKADGGGGGAHA